MTAQDVAVVIARLKERIHDAPMPFEYLMDDAIDALESQAKALSAACEVTEELRVDLAIAGCLAVEANDRALAAESRLAEAMRVIERLGSSQTFTVPFAMDQSSIACELKARIDAARDFLNAKEKTDAQ